MSEVSIRHMTWGGVARGRLWASGAQHVQYTFQIKTTDKVNKHMRNGQRILGSRCSSATFAFVSIHARVGLGYFRLFHGFMLFLG